MIKTSGATFSKCRKYRYTLWRKWGEDDDTVKVCAFIGLNPSTADETKDDPTIRRCIGFAKREGCNILVMLNIFPFRATDPKDMKTHEEDVYIKDENMEIVSNECMCSDLVIAAWGSHGNHEGRSYQMASLLSYLDVHCLGVTKHGQPRHPLYLSKDTPLEKWKYES